MTCSARWMSSGQEIDDGIKVDQAGGRRHPQGQDQGPGQTDQLDEKAKPFEEKVAQCDQTLVRLRDLLNADKPADIAGKTYSVAELKDMAGKVIQARKDAEKQIDGLQDGP